MSSRATCFVSGKNIPTTKTCTTIIAAKNAVFCASDHIAAQLLQSLNRLGIRVPQDLRLVGFDNVPFSNPLIIPLTTMEQSCRDIAISAFNALRERFANPTLPARTLMVAPRIIVRESCGAFLSLKKGY